MSAHIKGFVAVLVVGLVVLFGADYGLKWFKQKTQIGASDASGVKKTLRIGVDNWVGYLPLCSKELRTRMHNDGYRLQCDDDKADYAARMKRLRAGELEFAVTTVDSLLLNGGKENFPGTIIMVIDESSGGDAIVARKDKLASLEDLKTKSGYKIAFTAGSPSEHLLKSIAVHFDVPPLRNRQGGWRVSVNSSADALKQLGDGKVDAAVLWEPDVSRALAMPGMHRILGTENTRRVIVDVLTVSREFSRAQPEAVKLLMSHYFRVLRHFRDNPDTLTAEVKDATRMNEQQVTAMLKGVRWASLNENARDWFGVGGSTGKSGLGLIETLEATAQILVDSGDFRENPLPERDPYRMQHRVFIEDIYSTGLGAEASVKDKTGGARAFDALDDKQWERLAEVGTLKIRPISFQSGAADLSPEGKQELDSAAQNLAHYPNFRVVVRGHTGTRGDPESNRELSLERADAVRRYLTITHAIDETRLRAVGYGGERSLPRTTGESDRAHEYRLPRVELYLVSEAF